MQQKQQQSLTQINAVEWMFARYPLISKRKEAISSAAEAVKTNDLAISAIDTQIEKGITVKWIKAQLIEVLNFCGAFEAVRDTQVVIIARQICKICCFLSQVSNFINFLVIFIIFL